MKQILGIFVHWLPLGVAIGGVLAVVYMTVQQQYRQNLNDPQIQIVEDVQRALLSGKQPQEVIPQGERFDAGKNLAPFTAIFDESGNVLESNATVNGEAIKIPAGVFEYARSHKENRITWQPRGDTRIAVVVRPVPIESGWFVASGRNMSEVEDREMQLTQTIALGLAATLLLTFVFEIIGDVYRRRFMKV